MYLCTNINHSHMKAILTLLISALSCLGLYAQSATEYFSVGDPIKFGDTDFYLAWSAKPKPTYYIQEYLPKGETPEHYTQMLTVSVLFTDLTPEQMAQAKIDELERRKKKDPVTNYMNFKRDNEQLLEFLVSDLYGKNIKDPKVTTGIVEANLHYYRQTTINGKKASVLYFYSCRAYGDDILPFIQSIPDKRGGWYESILKMDAMPVFK